MTIPDAFNKALNSIGTYQIKGNNLMFYGADGKKILSFSKG